MGNHWVVSPAGDSLDSKEDMTKHLTTILCILALCGAVWATETYVGTAAALSNALAGASSGDTVYCSNGTYVVNLTVPGGVIVRSVSGNPVDVVLDGNTAGRVVDMTDEYSSSWLIGCTVKNGYFNLESPDYDGAGVRGGSVSNCIVENNQTVHEPMTGGGVIDSTVWNSIIRNNFGWGDGGMQNCTVHNSLITGNSNSNSATGGGGSGNCYLYNCTITANGPFGERGYNYYYNSIAWNNGSMADANFQDFNSCGLYFTNTSSITTDPAFVSESDFRLQTNSPCVDAGNNDFAAGSTDLAGVKRILHVTIDIGAYEFNEFPDLPLKAAYPIPTDDALNQLTNTVVSWQDGSNNASGYFISFGLSGSIAGAGYTTSTNYNPGALTYSSNYQWRVDASNFTGVTTGDVWAFTVMDTPPPAIPRINSGTIGHVNASSIFGVKGRVE
jgi:hypothetical protein